LTFATSSLTGSLILNIVLSALLQPYHGAF